MDHALPFRRAVLGAAVFLALSAAACGGGGGGGAAPPAANDGQAAAPTSADAAVPAGDPEAGKQAFLGTCSTCHGPDAMGLPGLGKQLVGNTFVAGKTDEEMIVFIKSGRPSSDPLNTTGVDMPPKGGNPALTDDDLANIVAYLRTLK